MSILCSDRADWMTSWRLSLVNSGQIALPRNRPPRLVHSRHQRAAAHSLWKQDRPRNRAVEVWPGHSAPTPWAVGLRNRQCLPKDQATSPPASVVNLATKLRRSSARRVYSPWKWIISCEICPSFGSTVALIALHLLCRDETETAQTAKTSRRHLSTLLELRHPKPA